MKARLTVFEQLGPKGSYPLKHVAYSHAHQGQRRDFGRRYRNDRLCIAAGFSTGSFGKTCLRLAAKHADTDHPRHHYEQATEVLVDCRMNFEHLKRLYPASLTLWKRSGMSIGTLWTSS